MISSSIGAEWERGVRYPGGIVWGERHFSARWYFLKWSVSEGIPKQRFAIFSGPRVSSSKYRLRMFRLLRGELSLSTTFGPLSLFGFGLCTLFLFVAGSETNPASAHVSDLLVFVLLPAR